MSKNSVGTMNANNTLNTVKKRVMLVQITNVWKINSSKINVLKIVNELNINKYKIIGITCLNIDSIFVSF